MRDNGEVSNPFDLVIIPDGSTSIECEGVTLYAKKVWTQNGGELNVKVN